MTVDSANEIRVSPSCRPRGPGRWLATRVWRVYGDDADARRYVQADTREQAEHQGARALGIAPGQIIARYVKTISRWVPSDK